MDYEWNVRLLLLFSKFIHFFFNKRIDLPITSLLVVRLKMGLSVILVERGSGVETKPIKTSYSATAGTAYITFDNVRVPIGNTLGEEGGGIFVILKYFSSFESLREPWTLRGLSSNFIHEHSQASKLAGQIAFLKSYSTVCGQDTARDPVQSRNHTDWNGQIN